MSLVYLPHLDYCLQRIGPGHPDIARDLRRIDSIAGDWYSCLIAVTAVTCDTSSPQATAAAIDELNVVIAD